VGRFKVIYGGSYFCESLKTVFGFSGDDGWLEHSQGAYRDLLHVLLES
jgi:hypothetical protein